MKWVTRKQIRVNRVATAWLIRRFIDPQAEFIFSSRRQSPIFKAGKMPKASTRRERPIRTKMGKAVALSKRWSTSIAQGIRC